MAGRIVSSDELTSAMNVDNRDKHISADPVIAREDTLAGIL